MFALDGVSVGAAVRGLLGDDERFRSGGGLLETPGLPYLYGRQETVQLIRYEKYLFVL